MWVTDSSFFLSVTHCLSLIWHNCKGILFSVQMWKRNTFSECMKLNYVYNEVLVELWEWLTSSLIYVAKLQICCLIFFNVISIMLTCHFHIINWKVGCVCVNVMDSDIIYAFWIYSWSERVQYMCTMFLLWDTLNPGKMSRSIHATLYLVPLGE